MRLSVSFLHGRFYSCVLALGTTNNMCTKIWAIGEANILVNIMVSPSGVPLEVSPEAMLCLCKCSFFPPRFVRDTIGDYAVALKTQTLNQVNKLQAQTVLCTCGISTITQL